MLDGVTFSPKQREFARAVFSGQYKYLMYGGAIRGGKTVALLCIIFALCKLFPRSRWAIVRKDLPTLRRNTLPSLEKLRPDPFVGDLNQGTWVYTCDNGSEIVLFSESISTDPDLNRWKGLEVNGFAFEEANELRVVSFNKGIERAGSWIIPPTKDDPHPKQPPPLILLTCNPAQNWVKEKFYDPWSIGALKAPFYYCPATLFDNPHLPAGYIESLKNLPEVEYERFVLGNWAIADDPAQLIKYEWIKAAQELTPAGGLHRLGVDVARYGDDDTVLCETRGNSIFEIVAYHGKNIEETAQIVAHRLFAHSINADECRVDTVGLGAGVADVLSTRLGYHVHEFVSGGTAIESLDFGGESATAYGFRDRRAQGWWTLREALRTGQFALPPDAAPKLLQDLMAPRYEMRSDRVIRVESKDDIKKRIGRSTDYGDALMQAVAPTPAASEWGFGAFRG